VKLERVDENGPPIHKWDRSARAVMVKEPAASGQIEGAEASSWMEEIGSDFSSWGESSLRELESGDEPLL